MRLEELARHRVERLEPAGVLMVEEPRLVLWGIHGAGEYVIGVHVHETYVERRGRDPLTGAPRETLDQLRERVMRTIVPYLPDTALHDSKGAAVGYFVYDGLPADHCRPKAYEEGAR
jgi:hypothetical protein